MTSIDLSAIRVERWTTASRLAAVACLIAIIGLAIAPAFTGAGAVDRMTALFIYIILAAMWNALAGYGGLVSIGQQLFFGLGAYFTIRIADFGINPFLSMGLAAIVTTIIAYPVGRFMLKLKGGEFAIGMWVLAELVHLFVNLDTLIQGETGTSLISLNAYDIDVRRNVIYWLALVTMTGFLTGLFLLLRSKTGAAIQAIRDSEEAAASLGVDAIRTKRLLFVLAAGGIAAAGALWLASAVSFQPKTYFSVQWTAYMIFMVLVGGIGRFEGAVLGAIIFFLIETWFATAGVWYLIGLGAVALVFSLALPKGLWGYLSERTGLRLLPVGYLVRMPDKS